MISGTWSVEFLAHVGAGADGVQLGTITFKDGIASGGDECYRYEGEYEMAGSTLNGTVTITHYAGPVKSIFGDVKEFELELSGTVSGDSFILEGRVTSSAGDDVALRLTRK